MELLRRELPKYGGSFIQCEDEIASIAMALGAGSVTPLQMAGGYTVFANGGYAVKPYLIERVLDGQGQVLMQAKPFRPGIDISVTSTSQLSRRTICNTSLPLAASPATSMSDCLARICFKPSRTMA